MALANAGRRLVHSLSLRCRLPRQVAILAAVIRYDEAGEPAAVPVVLLHGLGMPRQMWQPQLIPLAERHRVLVPDLLGLVGADEDPSFTVSVAAGAVADLVKIRVGRPVHLCGLSLGAVVATQVALDAPDVVASLILSGGQVRPPRLLMALQRLTLAVLPEKMIVGVPASVRQTYPDVAAAALIQHARVGRRGLLTAMRELAGVDFRTRLAEISAPALVLCGRRDRVNLPAARALAAGMTHAELRIIPDAGHVWNLEQPDLFTRTIEDWIDQRSASATAAEPTSQA
jgi:3-oxoadipate enol-lactonase